MLCVGGLQGFMGLIMFLADISFGMKWRVCGVCMEKIGARGMISTWLNFSFEI